VASETTRDALISKLNKRTVGYESYRNLLSGDGPLPQTARTDEYKRLMGLARVDIAQIIVESVSERLNVEGFRTDERSLDGDVELGKAWVQAGGPLESSLAFTESLSVGDGYLVLTMEDDRPVFAAESADRFVCTYEPGSRRKIQSALKLWHDTDENGNIVSYATVWDEAGATRWRSTGIILPGSSTWVQEESWENTLGRVPVVHLRNRPDLKTSTGRSELWGLDNDIDRINKLMADALLISEFSGFRIRTATGIDVEVDADGKPVQPFTVGPDRLLVSPNEQTKFDSLEETNIEPLLNAVKMAVTQVAALSRTPMFYLSGDLVNLSGDTLREMREQFRRKVQQRQAEFSGAMEEAGRMLAEATGGATPETLEVMWRDVEEVDRFQEAQAVAGLVAGGIIPAAQGQVDLGYSTIDRERMATELRAEQAQKLAQQRMQMDMEAAAAARASGQQDTTNNARRAGGNAQEG
jgi:hypothetical protein